MKLPILILCDAEINKMKTTFKFHPEWMTAVGWRRWDGFETISEAEEWTKTRIKTFNITQSRIVKVTTIEEII